jgi:hypothetical protein
VTVDWKSVGRDVYNSSNMLTGAGEGENRRGEESGSGGDSDDHVG